MSNTDPYDLERFVVTQRFVHDTALTEIRNGKKLTHWMWFIFPQCAGLGYSQRSIKYAIGSREEAHAYLAHPVLGPRLMDIAHAAMTLEGKDAYNIFGEPDDRKFQSCVTLFAQVSPNGSIFHELLDKYFDGQPDARTLELMGRN